VFNLDPAKLLVILVLVLVVLGPERLPRVARQLGAAFHELTRIRDQVTTEVRKSIPELDGLVPKAPTRSIRSILFDPDPAASSVANSADSGSGVAPRDPHDLATSASTARPDGSTPPTLDAPPYSPDDPAMN